VRAVFAHAQSSAKKLAPNQTPVVTVNGFTPDTQYHYRLRAYNGNGTSPNSNVIKVKTKPH
jgi:hypothetical protein